MIMGCVRTITRRIGGFETYTRRLSGDLIPRFGRVGEFKTRTSRAITSSIPYFVRVGGSLRIRCSLICTINHAKGYVRIEPEYLWLTESNRYQGLVNVQSNTGWKAE